jgi:hypothetical protein
MDAILFVLILFCWRDMTGGFPFEGAVRVSIDGSVHEWTTGESTDLISEKSQMPTHPTTKSLP